MESVSPRADGKDRGLVFRAQEFHAFHLDGGFAGLRHSGGILRRNEAAEAPGRQDSTVSAAMKRTEMRREAWFFIWKGRGL